MIYEFHVFLLNKLKIYYKQNMLKHFIFVLLFSFQLNFHAYSQTKYYVNNNSLIGDIYCSAIGNDITNDGKSPDKPKETIANLLSSHVLTGGDTIFIDAGTYVNNSFRVSTADDGLSLNSYLVFKGADTSKTLFVNNISSTTKYNVFIDRAQFLWFEGISFSNTRITDSAYNILKHHGKSTVIKNCKFDIANTNTATTSWPWNIYLRCNFNSNLDMQHTLISGNLFTNSNRNGVAIFGLGDVDNSRLERNTISMTGSASRGIVFRYTDNTDESTNRLGYFWPISDTVFRNTINCAGTGLDYRSDVSIPVPSDARTRGMLEDHLVESNTINISGSTNEFNSSIYIRAGGSYNKFFKILKNRLIGGFSGIWINDLAQNLVIQNNYICSQRGLYRESIFNGETATASTEEDNDGNQFVHNSVYTSGSCIYFATSGSTYSQFDWDIRNNILYTTNTSGSASCLNFESILLGSTNSNMRYCNSNLFYVGGNDTGKVAKIGPTFYSLSAASPVFWSSPTRILVNNDGPNDINSFFAAPKWENKDVNCDLDLLQDVFWPTSFPNLNYLTGTGTKFIYPNLAENNTDIKNIPSRSLWTIGAFEAGSSTLLPVQLLAFNARLNSQRVLLDWQTASEQNSNYFDVEKSKDGQSGWTFVSRVQSRGNSNVRADYQAIDHRPYGGVSYYRLKQVDQDGRFAYSQTRKIINESKTITVYPNPATDHAVIEGLDKNRSNMIHLLDVTGKLLSERFVKDSQYRFDLTKLPPGVYHVVVNGSEHFQLVKRQ